MNKNLNLIATFENLKEQRLDKFLSKQVEGYSRSYFQNLINQGKVSVNSKVVTKESYLIREGDEINIEIPEEKTFDLTPKKVDFEVIDIQKDFIVINKPAGLVVHHSHITKDESTLVHGLLYMFQELSEFSDNIRPGIVHRLDKDTSGLILIARNIPAQIALSNLFKNRQIKKTYLAVVKFHPQSSGSIDLPIGRHPVARHKMVQNGILARAAKTDYKVAEYFDDATLVEAYPITGRTHQIRVHFAAIGHPLVGDVVYGKESKEINRHALHAYRLEFQYKGKNYSYTCQIPEDMNKLISILRKNKKVES